MNRPDLKRAYQEESSSKSSHAAKKVWSRDKIISIILQEVQKVIKNSERVNDQTDLSKYFNDDEIIKIKIFKSIGAALSINVCIPAEHSAGLFECPQHTVAEFADEIIFAMNNPQDSKTRG